MKDKSFSPLVLLILGSILLRLAVYFMLPQVKEFGQRTFQEQLFYIALTDHFADFMRFTTQIPPLNYLLYAGILDIAGIQTAFHIRAFLLLVMTMNVAAIGLLYKAAKMLNAGGRFAYIVLGLFSAALVPFELWREGMHYDHFTLFFTSFFAYALVRFILDENKKANMLLVAAAGTLLVSQSAVNAAVVPVSTIAIVACLYLQKRKFKELILALALTAFLPLVALFAISKKNQSSGEVLTSNKSGPAMMMVVQRAYNYDSVRVRQFAKSNGVPEWYIWAYEHYTVPTNAVTGQSIQKGWWNLSQAFGICFFEKAAPSNYPWGFNFHSLAQHLRETGETGLAAQVGQDSADAVSRPYRFAGFSPELSPRWIAIYGNVSQRLFFKAITQHPFGMLKSFIAQQGIFCIYGPLFPYNTIESSPSLLARSGLRTVQKLPFYPLFVVVTVLFALLAWIAYAFAWGSIFLIKWKFIKRIFSRGAWPVIPVQALLAIPVICIAVAFSCLVGGENDRYFMQLTPYLVLLATCLPAGFRAITIKK